MANNQDGNGAVIEDIFDPADLPFGVNVAVGVRLRVDKGNGLGLPFTQQLELLLRRVPKHCHDLAHLMFFVSLMHVSQPAGCVHAVPALPSFVSRRGLSNTNQRLSLSATGPRTIAAYIVTEASHIQALARIRCY